MTQRWREGRASYRPAGEPIETWRYEVAIIPRAVAKRFVEAHHYSGTFPAGLVCVGLFEGAELVGVAAFSQPASQYVLDIMPDGRDCGIELGRFVLADRVPANGETWFLRRAFAELARLGYTSVLAYADPLRRTNAAGVVTVPGHVGTIYQALNGVYTGRGRARPIAVMPSGRTYNERTSAKAKAGDRGRAYAIRQLVAEGAAFPERGEDVSAWVSYWTGRLCRRVPHPGNHRYVWGIDRRASRLLLRHLEQRGVRIDLPRPKEIEVAIAA